MIAVMQRLQMVAGLVPSPIDDQHQWVFHKQLADKSKTPDFFKLLVEQHTLLTIEYSIFCANLLHNYSQPERQETDITEQLIAGLMMAELLAYIYGYYLTVPREVLRFEDDQAVYRQLLREHHIIFADNATNAPVTKPDTCTQWIRNTTASANWLRLFLIRSKRVLNSIVPLMQHIHLYVDLMHYVDKFANPAISYLSFLFFLPRLIANLFLLIKHTVPHWWMDKHEKKLGFVTRLHAQLQRRWFELANDSVWLTAGFVTYFFLVGSLAPVAIYLGIALYIYDVILASIRFHLELSRLTTLQDDCRALLARMRDNHASPKDLLDIARYQEHLAERIDFEQRRLLISILNTTALTLAILICLPAVAINPVIPMIGACLLVAITIAAYMATKLIEQQRPVSNIANLLNSDSKGNKQIKLSTARVGFFHPKPKEDVTFSSEELEMDVNDAYALTSKSH